MLLSWRFTDSRTPSGRAVLIALTRPPVPHSILIGMLLRRTSCLESFTAAVACVASFGRRFVVWALEHVHIQMRFVQVSSLSRYCVSRLVQAFTIHFMFSLAAWAWFTRFLINVSLAFFGLHLSFIRTRKRKSKSLCFAVWCWMTKCEDLLLKNVATWIATEALTDSGTSLFAMVYLIETS